MGNLTCCRRIAEVTPDKLESVPHCSQVDEPKINGKENCRYNQPNQNQGERDAGHWNGREDESGNSVSIGFYCLIYLFVDVILSQRS